MKNYTSRAYILSGIVLFTLLASASAFVFPYFVSHATVTADSFTIEEYVNGSWQFVASAPFPGRPYPGNRYTTKSFVLPVSGNRIRITHNGGTQIAHLDRVILDTRIPASVRDLSDATSLPTKKFASADYDVVDNWNRTIEFSWHTKGSSLTVTGVAEEYKGVPYRWPHVGYNTYTIGDTKTYTFTEVPVSSHPFAMRYAYVSTDKKNLVVKVDWTSDNTYDTGKDGDWAEVDVVTNGGLKTFRINSGEKSEWGTEDFTYTRLVSWQHEIFTFSIPLNQIGTSHDKSIQFQIRYYGTDGGGGAGGGGDGGGGAGDTGAADAGGGGVSPLVFGCMDPVATNYNPAATSPVDAPCTYPPPPAPVCTEVPQTPVACSAFAGTLSGVDYGIPAGFTVGTASWTLNSCTNVPKYIGGCTPPPPPPPAPVCTEVPQTPVACSAFAGTLSGVDYGIPAGFTVGTASWTLNSCTNVPKYIGGCTPPSPIPTSSAPVPTPTPVPTPPPAPSGGGGGSAPAAPTPTCTLIVAPASVTAGSSSVLSWTTTNATAFTINNGVGAVTPVGAGTNSVSPVGSIVYTGTATGAGGSITCSATVTVTPIVSPPPSGGGGSSGGGSGGGSIDPTILLTALPHVTAQPLAYLYLSQIPYTGLDLGPVSMTVYWIMLIGISLVLAYLLLFRIVPILQNQVRVFGTHIKNALNAHELSPVVPHAVPVARPMPPMPPVKRAPPEPIRSYSSYDGFKSFANNGALSIEDIVKGLSRHHHNSHNVSPNVEPVYENVEPIASATTQIPPSLRNFATALLEGDRTAVFAGLRQHLNEGGTPEKLINSIVFLFDDAYRARVDGTPCDQGLARLTARLDTPTLERLIAALATAIDSSYSIGVIGAKLALTRALAILGA